MTKELPDPLDDDWSFDPFRLVLEDPTSDKDNWILQLPLLTKAQLLDQYVLPKRSLPASEIRKTPLSSLLGTLPPSSLTKVPPWFQITKSFVQLCRTEKGEDVILICKCGHGKTTITNLYCLDRTFADRFNHVLSIVPFRGVGKTQLDKFQEFSELLVGGESLCEGYFWGDNEKKQEIRESEEDISLLSTTLLTHLGSLTKYYPERYIKEGNEKYFSHNLQWAKRLTSPSILFIDEVDSFSPDSLSLLVPIVRVLKWKNPKLQVILSSGTLGNPEDLAPRFFGYNSPYKLIRGSGRRGKLHINVYYETIPHAALEEALMSIMDLIDEELAQLEINPNHTPKKVILFLNHKLEIEIRNITKQLSHHFNSVHGNMFFDCITEKLDEFQTDPYKICLVATQIIQSGVDLPDVKWAVFYGLLENPQQFQQLRERINRKPEHIGRLDIILRENYSFEKDLSDPKKTEERKAFILQEDPIPIHLPWYTPLSLRLMIAFATLLGVTEILWRIKKDLSHLTDSSTFQRHLEEACEDLLVHNIIRLNSEGEFKPTPQTKEWIFTLVNKDKQRSYTIIREENGKKQIVGKIDHLTLLKHNLIGQNLPLGINQKVLKVINKKRRREVYVERMPADHFYYRNIVESYLSRTAFHTLDMVNHLALITVTKVWQVVEGGVDKRTNDREKALMNIEPLKEEYRAIFIGQEAPLAEKNHSLTITYLKDTFLPNLPFDTPLELYEYEDTSLGEGFILVSKSQHNIIDLVYEHIQDELLNSKSKRRSILSEIAQEEIDQIERIHHSLCDTPFNHFKEFRERFQNVIVIIPDVHLNGKPFEIQDQTIDFKAFWYYLLSQLQSASHIVFNGDTLDWTDTEEEMKPKMLVQYYTLLEIVDELNLRKKTIFTTGNHDYDLNFFLWKKLLHVVPKLELQMSVNEYIHIHHGHNIGLESLGEITEENIQVLRRRLGVSDDAKLVLGHTHDLYGRCKKNLGVLQVPPFRKYWKSPLKKGLGWLGVLGYEPKYELENCEIAIDA